MRVSWVLAPVMIAGLIGGPALERVVSRVSESPREGSVRTALRACDEAGLERGAIDAAHRRARAGGDWESLLEIGDAYRCLGEEGGPRATRAERQARLAYQTALRAARRAESVDGVLRAAEAFARLGDAEGVEQSVRVARELAAWDPEATADVDAATAGLADLLDGAEGAR